MVTQCMNNPLSQAKLNTIYTSPVYTSTVSYKSELVKNSPLRRSQILFFVSRLASVHLIQNWQIIDQLIHTITQLEVIHGFMSRLKTK